MIAPAGQTLLTLVAAILLPIVWGAAAATAAAATASATSSTTGGGATDVHVGHAHKNMALIYANQAGHQQQHQQQQQQHQQHGFYYGYQSHNDGSVVAARKSARRSYDSDGNAGSSAGGSHHSYNFGGAATLNGLTNLSGLRHISSGFGGSGAAAAATAKQQIPIYEEQQESDYGVALGASGAARYSGENNPRSHTGSAEGSYTDADAAADDNDALSVALHNLRTADGTHNGFRPSLGYGIASRHSSATADAVASTLSYATAATQHQQQQQLHQPNDKISDGNFLHRYEHNSGYDEVSAAATYAHQQQQHQQQLEQQQQYYASQQQSAPGLQYFSPHDAHSASSDEPSTGASYDAHNFGVSGIGHEEGADESDAGHAYDESSNYLHGSHEQSHAGPPPPDVINYIPYPVVKKVHVPVREPVQIPVSHAVIVPVSKPVPIHIPVTKQVAVPIEKQLRVPVERVVPYPVEKPVPVPVEKRIPFPVVKYIPVRVPHPFPVKVPVFKTILHKVKGGWW